MWGASTQYIAENELRIMRGVCSSAKRPFMRLTPDLLEAGVKLETVGAFYAVDEPLQPATAVYADAQGHVPYMWFFKDAHEWQVASLLGEIQDESPREPLVLRRNDILLNAGSDYARSFYYLLDNGIEPKAYYSIIRVQGLESKLVPETFEEMLKAWQTS